MRTSISKKLLAGALSVMMVLSLVAPTGAQAASKYSVTGYKTVKAGKTYTYKIKGVKKSQYVKVQRNVSGETVKYNKKKLTAKTKVNGTGKNLTLKVKFSEKNKNYTGKFTVRIYNAKSNKLVKKIVKSVKVKTQKAAKVAVTGVALSTTTPKVGDTITATVAPADATNVTYAWYMGDSATQVETAIEGATSASLTVTEAMVGKFIKVVVGGEEGSSASAVTTAGVEAAATEKIAIVSAKQIGAAKIEVTFNKAFDKAAYNVTLAKGTAKQDVTVGETTTVATIETGVALSTGEYTVTVTNKTDATETAESKVTCEKAEIKKIDFLGNELILTSSNFTAAAVAVKGYNQFDEEVALSGSLKPYTSKGTATYNQKESKIEISVGTSATMFQVGEVVNVTAVYTMGSTVLQISKNLTVSNVATLSKLELGELATTRASLKGKKVSLENFKTNTYYLPVKEAKDQYGNNLSASELDAMMIKPDEDAAKAGNLFIMPNAATGSYAYVTGFEKLDDGTIAMKLALGGINKPGKAIISITGVSGFSGTAEVEILDNAYIAKLDVTAPNLYANVPATLEVAAVDQDGNAVDLYDYVPATATGDYTGAKNEFKFGDTNNLTDAHTTITIPKDATLSVSRNTSKKTVSFKYTPAKRTQASTDIITIQTAKPDVANLTWNVDVTPSPAGIKGLAIGTNMAIGGEKVLNVNTVKILDSNNSVIDYTDNKAVAGVDFITDIKDAKTAGYYAVVAAGKGLAATAKDGDVTLKADGTVKGSIKVKVTLEYVETAGAVKELLADKSFTFNVSTGKFESYKAENASDLLYVNANSADYVSFYVYGVDENGTQILTEDYTVTCDSDLKVVGQTVYGNVSGIGAKGTAVATIWAELDGKKVAVASVDIPYDVAAPVAQTAATYKHLPTGWAASTLANFENVTEMVVCANGDLHLVNDGYEYALMIEDQYGLPMENTKWRLDGSSIESKSATWNESALTATSAKVSGSWVITGKNVTPEIEASVEVGTETGLRAALSGAAQTIYVTKDIELLGDLANDADHTIVISKNVTLDLGANKLENAGTIKVDGSLVTSGAVDNNGTITVNGNWDHKTGAITQNEKGVIAGAGHVNFTSADVSGGTFNVTGNTLVLNNVTFAAAAKLGGHVKVLGTCNFGGYAVVLTNGLNLDVSAKAAAISNGNAIEVAPKAEVVIVKDNGDAQTLTNKSEGNVVVDVKESGATSSDKNLVVEDESEGKDQHKMKALTLISDKLTGDISVEGCYGKLTLSESEYTWDAEKKVATYTYDVSGTLKYVEGLAGVYGNEYHYMLFVKMTSKNESGAVQLSYKKLTEGTYAVDANGEMVEENGKETEFGFALKKAPETGKTPSFTITYTFKGQTVQHIVNFTNVTYEPSKA
ncbi:MAG: hypothetical protein E7280_06765 [Lachnospiraceae bacterium]|nr:hypothetical protein [Lachnospiraceae bacterium]